MIEEPDAPQARLWHPIGTIRTPFTAPNVAPIQGAMAPDAAGVVDVLAQYAQGLRDVDGFSHLILLYVHHRAGAVELVRAPFLDDAQRGLFATRHPARPNPIGLTIVRLVRVEGPRLHVLGVDMLDGTPLLDVKPYVPRWDSVPDATAGWLERAPDRPKPEGRE